LVAYIIRRLLQAVFVLFIVSLVVFLVMRLLPGDPILMYLSKAQVGALSAQQIELTRHEFGLDKPMVAQYADWIAGIFHGKFGKSVFYNKQVSILLAERVPVTLYLGLLSFVIANVLGIIAGIISAVRRGKAMDSFVTVIANIGITIPIFWLAIMLIYAFGLKLGWLPIQGYTSPLEDFGRSTRQIIMPVFCLTIFVIGACARQTRSSMLEVLHQDYVRTAWSKGLRERTVIMVHVLKNGIIPVVTLMGMHIGQILGGSVLIETVFNIQGIGRLSVDAVLSLDYAVVQAIVLVMAIMVVLANLLVDISYGWLDPRIRYG